MQRFAALNDEMAVATTACDGSDVRFPSHLVASAMQGTRPPPLRSLRAENEDTSDGETLRRSRLERGRILRILPVFSRKCQKLRFHTRADFSPARTLSTLASCNLVRRTDRRHKRHCGDIPGGTTAAPPLHHLRRIGHALLGKDPVQRSTCQGPLTGAVRGNTPQTRRVLKSGNSDPLRLM